MSPIRKQHGSKVKARIALEATANNETLGEIARRHRVHPIQVGKWRKELVERAHELFTDGRKRGAEEQSEAVEALYEQIGRLKVENDFLKKNLVLGTNEKRAAIEPDHRHLSIAAQCALLGLSRSRYCYEPS